MATGTKSQHQDEYVKVEGLVGKDTVGTVATEGTTTVIEYANGVSHCTKLTMTAFSVGTIVESTSLGFGSKFYTMPAGTQIVDSMTLIGALTSAGTTKTDAPEVGVGSVVAVGAVATLTTATWENFIDGGASGATGDADAKCADINGTEFYKANLSTIRPIMQTTPGVAKAMFLNLADAWTSTSNGLITFTGVIIIEWRHIN